MLRITNRIAQPRAICRSLFSTVSKVAASPKAALEEGLAHAGRRDGLTICVGGFGLCGIPESTIGSIADDFPDVGDITAVSNNAGEK
jgi:3-oxoacid CoA-transferase subunit A